jgi:hypothetical protein
LIKTGLDFNYMCAKQCCSTAIFMFAKTRTQQTYFSLNKVSGSKYICFKPQNGETKWELKRIHRTSEATKRLELEGLAEHIFSLHPIYFLSISRSIFSLIATLLEPLINWLTNGDHIKARMQLWRISCVRKVHINFW